MKHVSPYSSCADGRTTPEPELTSVVSPEPEPTSESDALRLGAHRKHAKEAYTSACTSTGSQPCSFFLLIIVGALRRRRTTTMSAWSHGWQKRCSTLP